MKGTVFRVAIQDAEPAAHGFDAVEFLVSANVGEEPRPLDKVASGGELSRIALALKTCTRGKSPRAMARTLVFDEVDSGVGGAAAETVGRRLKQIALGDQVLCVTHLAQIAGFADHHYVSASARPPAAPRPMSANSLAKRGCGKSDACSRAAPKPRSPAPCSETHRGVCGRA